MPKYFDLGDGERERDAKKYLTPLLTTTPVPC